MSVAKKLSSTARRPEPTFEGLFGRPAEHRRSAHGRVNLIGEHTDYNDGFVLPTPIPQKTDVELARRTDDRVRAFSLAEPEMAEYRLGSEKAAGAWSDYLQGVTRVLAAAGYDFGGFEILIRSDVPIGAGLSSSAAFEISVLRAIDEAFNLRIEPLEIARYGQRVETEFIGAPIGIMDQMSASIGLHGQALFLDTRTLGYERIPLPPSIELVVIDSGVAHAHGTGDYRVRRKECEDAAHALGVPKLRDADLAMLARSDALIPPLDRRARHVITENERVLEAAGALRKGDATRLGELFYLSQASMRDDFEISISEIDALVDLARMERDVFGARMTGGGFGGSVVVLVHRGKGRDVALRVAAEYRARTGQKPAILIPPLDSYRPVEM